MFGRVRPSSSSPDTLGSPPSKILKNDPLSVYESTLMKLKMGSQRDISPQPETAVELDINGASASDSECSLSSSSEDTMKTLGDCSSACLLKCSLHVLHREEMIMMDTDCYSASFSSSSSSSECQSTDSTNRRNGNLSVIYMFSKFKNAQQVLNSSPEAMALETTEGSSTSLSQCFTDLRSTQEQPEQE